MNHLVVSWEAVYDNGVVDRERDGVRYAHINRARLKSFRLVSPGEIICEMPATDGRTGHNLVYRRRTIVRSGSREVWFLVGWIPMGPVVAIQPETARFLKADTFHVGGGPLGAVHPLPEEGWLLAHGVDMLATRPRIVLDYRSSRI